MSQNTKLKNLSLSFFAATLWVIAAFLVVNFTLKKSTPENISAATNAESYIVEVMNKCKDGGEGTQCYKKAAKDFLSQFPLAEILSTFQKHEKEPAFFDNCHATSHYLGQEAYKLKGNVKDVFLESTHACLGGTFHGAVEGYFMEKQITIDGEHFKEAGQAVATICGKSEDYPKAQQFTECNHGLGHALMFVTDNDLVEALKLCDNLGSQNEKELCYTGALMQNADSVGDKDHPSKYYKEGDLLYPCYILDSQYQRMCYTYGVLSKFQFDFEQAVKICNSIPQEFGEACFQTYGRDRTMVTADPKEIDEQCALIKNENYYLDCMGAAAYNLVVRFGIDSPLPAEVCQLLPAEDKKGCMNQVINSARNQTKDPAQRQQFCSSIQPEDLREGCMQ